MSRGVLTSGKPPGSRGLSPSRLKQIGVDRVKRLRAMSPTRNTVRVHRTVVPLLVCGTPPVAERPWRPQARPTFGFQKAARQRRAPVALRSWA
jgi:hypothetical protein